MIEKKTIDNAFLIIVLLAALYVVYLLLAPFLMVILLSGVLVSIFYGLYQWFVQRLGGREGFAALVMVLLIALVIILPATNFLFYLSKRSIEGFSAVTGWINSGALERTVREAGVLDRFTFIDPSILNVRQYLITVSSRVSGFLLSGGKAFIVGTTQFLTSLILMLFTMFFLFRDGERLVNRVMYLTPLSNKYDKIIFQRFRDVSFSTIVSTFLTAIAQGVVGGISFVIVGVPALFAGVVMAFLSLLPYVGAAIVWAPAGIYLLVTGKIWQGIFLLIWGAVVVSLVDNVLRPILIKGKAQVHPLLIFFSIFGGIIAFGFWGMILGPIIIAIAFTLLHIYELEYRDVLEQ